VRGVAVVALAFLIGVGAPANRSWGDLVSSQSDDVDESLYGEAVDFDFTLQVHLFTCTTGTTIDTAFDETCERRTFSVPHVSAGQRIPLPRALDG